MATGTEISSVFCKAELIMSRPRFSPRPFGTAYRESLYGQEGLLGRAHGGLVVHPIFRKLTRPSDVCVRIEPPPKESRRQGHHQRSEMNAARTSAEKSSGSSQAAKWPPLSTTLK